MNVTELMIGDIVSVSGKPMHVTFAMMQAGIEVKPIPLTPEILEKNGFEKKKDYVPHYRNTCFYMIEKGNDVYLEVNNDGVYLSVVYESYTRAFESVAINKVSYVHELQHALKLCGIEKEVVV